MALIKSGGKNLLHLELILPLNLFSSICSRLFNELTNHFGSNWQNSILPIYFWVQPGLLSVSVKCAELT